MRTPQTIERLVQRLLADVLPDFADPPVPVQDIAAKLGTNVRYQDAEDGLSGALLRRGDQRIIAVNASHSQTRQRFTIAHEIGHLRLHKAELFVDHVLRVGDAVGGVSKQLRVEALRSSNMGEVRNDEETEANRFAASLLMPVALLARSLENKQVPLREMEVSELARLYQVSVQAMSYRLLNLGIPVSA